MQTMPPTRPKQLVGPMDSPRTIILTSLTLLIEISKRTHGTCSRELIALATSGTVITPVRQSSEQQIEKESTEV